ncbi:MAG: phosphate/phosphite/phosphonate ABC transporter substrate-binding protein [Nitrospirae bacterium]|nr:phosphate/phosphite/phosphonate ABC transporter substrate-binding protein [Nitrospirota bacterium]
MCKSLLLLCLPFLLFSGCVRGETPKKVSLSQKTVEAPAEEISYPPQDTLWFGFDLRLGPKEDFRIYIPLLKYLENETGRRFRIKFSEKYEDTVEDLGKGVTQFAAVGALSFVIGEAKYGIKYLVSGVNKEGDATYHSIIFTKPKSAIRDLKDLKGKCFAFGAKMSTQGHLIPRKMLEDDGITLNELGKYLYTGSHFDTVKSVLNGECDAGGIQDVLAKKLESEGKITILKISGPYPNSLIAYNNAVDGKTVEAVRAALLAFEPMGKHKDMLADWDKTEMPLGFTKVNELELEKVKALARGYGLLVR